MYIRPTFCVSVGLSFKLILSVYKDCILIHGAIPKYLGVGISTKIIIRFRTPGQYPNLLDGRNYNGLSSGRI